MTGKISIQQSRYQPRVYARYRATDEFEAVKNTYMPRVYTSSLADYTRDRARSRALCFIDSFSCRRRIRASHVGSTDALCSDRSYIPSFLLCVLFSDSVKCRFHKEDLTRRCRSSQAVSSALILSNTFFFAHFIIRTLINWTITSAS